jgi:hypothetical protein
MRARTIAAACALVVGLAASAIDDYIQAPWEEQFLTADAVVDVRTREVVTRTSSNMQRVYVGASFEVIDGRTGDLPFDETVAHSPIAETLTALRQAYERNTRYRRYDDLRERPFETLRYKTGWVYLGDLAVLPGMYVEQPLEWPRGVAFTFSDGRDPSHAMPKRNERIRLK